MKKSKRLLSLLMCATLCIALMIPAFAQSAAVISNPYADIDWDTVNQYKTALHTHTNASDGDDSLKASLERHVETGFDIVATTDHGTVNYSWEYENPNKLVYGAMNAVGKSEGELEYLGKEGTFANGTSYTCSTNEKGDEYLGLPNGETVLRIPYGIENNAVSVNAHVNSWFADYCDNSVTTYETAIRGVSKNDGVCVINHPGEYTKARYEIHSEDAYNTDNFAYAYYVNKFSSLISKNDCCIGIDINSKGDSRTRFDRVLWDVLLERFSANGENVYAIASSDAHQLNKIDTGSSILLMNEKTSADARSALQNGEFFAASTCIGNYDELVDIGDALKANYGETELYTKVKGTSDAMAARIAAIESGELDADEDIGFTFSFLDGEGYCTSRTRPAITNVSVDNTANTISIDTENALLVRWISNGELICTTTANSASFNVASNASRLGNYVRAEVFGEGGIVYTQAFLLNEEANSGKADVIDGIYVNGGFFDFLLAIFNNWGDILSRMISNLFK